MRRLPAVIALSAALTLVPAAALACNTPGGATAVVGTGDVAVGTFTGRPTGSSVFSETGSTITLVGRYANLRPNGSYFSVVYGNNNCDPAQAFPVGPFTTDSRGRASVTIAAPNPNNIDVAKTMSISVRRGDNNSDIDGDGITGPSDVVAVAGKPGVGLIQCDNGPTVISVTTG